jgi:hypothetical protein
MQSLGYVLIRDSFSKRQREVKVLRRKIRNGVSLKLRDSGKRGTHLEDETAFLVTRKDLSDKLLAGLTIKI